MCVEERVCLFAMGGGMGREGKVFFGCVIFPLENKGVTWEQRQNPTDRTDRGHGAAARIRRVENKKIVYQL